MPHKRGRRAKGSQERRRQRYLKIIANRNEENILGRERAQSIRMAEELIRDAKQKKKVSQ